MPLESASYISDLNAANPTSTDSVAQSDDHIRLIKAAIKATFPNITGPVTATHSALNTPIPAGVIVMWSGATAPSGWNLCDGTNGTPDLRNRFVVGSGTSFTLGTTGGSSTSGSAGSHTHTMVSAGDHSHTGATGGTALTVEQIPAHTHSYTYYRGPTLGETTSAGYLANTSVAGTTGSTGGGLAHTHPISSDGSHTHTVNAVGDHTHAVTPPYYALAYIMKL